MRSARFPARRGISAASLTVYDRYDTGMDENPYQPPGGRRRLAKSPQTAAEHQRWVRLDRGDDPECHGRATLIESSIPAAVILLFLLIGVAWLGYHS